MTGPSAKRWRVSAIIPVYNRSARLIRSLRSVLNQDASGVDLEVIVVDDGSTEEIRLDDMAGKVKLLRLNKNSGPAAARNFGVLASQGELIAFLDSDDIWLKNKLENQIRLFERTAQPDRLGLSAIVSQFLYLKSTHPGQIELRIPRPAATLESYAQGCWSSPGSTLLVHRQAFEVVGTYDEGLRRLEDFDWLFRFGRLGGVTSVVDQPGAYITPSRSANVASIDACCSYILEKFKAVGSPPLPPDVRATLEAYLAFEQAAAAKHAGEYNRFSKHIFRSLWSDPVWLWKLYILDLACTKHDVTTQFSNLLTQQVD
jgi:glycosyltransferase involved in cell wall biosynthesis